MGFSSRNLDPTEPTFSYLGQRHANLLYINRRKCVLFVNDKTLLNFVILDIDHSQIRELPEHFRISIGTLRHWEQGLRSPRGAARVLLRVVEHNPKAVIKAIEP
jgi:hypothetical protein